MLEINPLIVTTGGQLKVLDAKVSFDDNAVVLIEKQGKEMGPKGNRVFGPVPRELVERGWNNIASLAPEIV